MKEATFIYKPVRISYCGFEQKHIEANILFENW
jgi:hypothetical protein